MILTCVAVPAAALGAPASAAPASTPTPGRTATPASPAAAAAPPLRRPDLRPRAEARRVDRVPTPRPRWFDCSALYVPRAQCALVALPLDYDRPKGPTTRVAVLRIPAADPARRIGSLFVNPGGPGGSGVELATAAPTFLDTSVLRRFDVVGFDPRGTNLSDPVQCWNDVGARARALTGLAPAFPVGGAEEAAAVRSAEAFGRACSTRGGAPAGAMSTAEVARDMDVLRRAVGDRRLTYLGFSYGTYLGQVYASLFPSRVRAMALDGVVDPVAWAGTRATRDVPQTARLGSAQAAARALDEALVRCRAAGPAYCALASRGDPRATYRRVTASLLRTPIVLRDGDLVQTYTYADVVATLLDMLYSPRGPEDVDAFLGFLAELQDPAEAPARAARARAGLRRITLQRKAFRAVGLVTTAERTAFRRAAGRAGYAFAYPNGPEAYQAVLCSDGLHPGRADRWPRYATAADRTAPGFGRLWTWASAPCARSTWTVRDEDAYRGPFTRRTAAPVLVVGAVHDPATPYASAVTAARRLPGSRLLTSASWGHTAFGTSACVDRAVQAYLVATTLPAAGARCVGADQPFAVPVDDRADDASRAAVATSATRSPGTTSGAGSGRGAGRVRPPVVPLRP